MKKKVRKMSLNRETLRSLDNTNLKNVAGGATDAASCASYPNTCPPCTGGTTTRDEEDRDILNPGL